MVKERSSNLKTAINILSSVGVLAVNLCISFFLSPYIIRTIGIEANGFVTLANNFVMYANLAVTALNAMASRFITIAYIQKDYEKANLYYNSVFWGNLIIVGVLLLPAIVLVIRLEAFVSVPDSIVRDVKWLFSFVFLCFFVRTGAPNYDCGTYITNRLDLMHFPDMMLALLRCVLLVCLFALLLPRVWIVGAVSFVCAFIALVIAGYYTHRLTPELKVHLRNPVCSWNAIKELVGAGIWSSIGSGGYMLLNGLDLLLCNIFLGPALMGVLALSKTLGGIVGQLVEAIRSTFAPELVIAYAKGDKEQVYANLLRAMKILTVISTIPAAGVVVMGDAFFALWVPSQNARLLGTITSLSIASLLVNSGVSILLNVFSTVNRVRLNALIMLLSGGVSLVITLILILYTEYDIYAVAGVSSIVTICKNWFFVVPTASRLLGFRWNQFYSAIVTSSLCSAIIVAIGAVVRLIVPVDTWLSFFLACGMVGCLGVCINFLLVLNKAERRYLFEIVKRRVGK